MKIGYVSIIGKPNVGKSSILNAIFDKKISIVSKKAQTTRNSISNIYEDDDSQIIFVDTPGIHNFNISINKFMNKSSFISIRGADTTVLVFDGSHKFDEEDEFIFNKVTINSKKLFVLNKIDQTNIGLISELRNKLKKIYNINDEDIIEVSVKDKFNIDLLLNKIKDSLPEGEKVYIEEDDFEKNKFFISEIIREETLNYLDKEVPHAVFVDVKSMEYDKGSMFIDAFIIVEKESQKAIIIGKGGNMIKKIGSQARKQIEKEYKKHVDLNLSVTCSKNWRSDEKFLKKHNFLDLK